jgi:AraC-like DNA-binding protein
MLFATDSNGVVTEAAPRALLDLIPASFLLPYIQDYENQRGDTPTPIIYTIEPGYYLGVARFDDEGYLFVGPVSPIEHEEENVTDFVEYVISAKDVKEFKQLLSSTPTIHYRRLVSMISCVVSIFWGNDFDTSEIIFVNGKLSDPRVETDKKYTSLLFSKRESTESHTPSYYEDIVFDAISTGNVELMQEMIAEPFPGQIGQLSKDFLQHYKFVFVAIMFAACRSAIKGGAPAEEARSLFDAYCLQVDELTEPAQIVELIYIGVQDFCERVSKVRRRGTFSAHTEKAVKYISAHLHEDIHLEDVADVVGVSMRVLSKQFRQETGLSVPSYVHAMKIREAKYLIRYTTDDIASIANKLKYSSQSYFSAIFKKEVGCSPVEFRQIVELKALD